MTTVGILEQFVEEKPSGGSWDAHRAWAGKVTEFLGEVYGDAVREAFANIQDKHLSVVIERQCGKLLGLIKRERGREGQDSLEAGPPQRPLAREPSITREPVADPEAHSSLLPNGADVALVTALTMELRAILRHGGPWSRITPSKDSPRTFHLCHTESGVSVVATCALGMGQLNAALATRDIIQKWRPKKVLLVGIAGGLGSHVQLGDIVVSEQVVDYEIGKITPRGVEPRWSVYPCDPILLDRLRNFQSSEWLSGIAVPRPDRRAEVVPRIIHGVVLSGNKVIADEKTAGALASVWRRAAAIEMEGAGIAAALHQIKNAPSFIVIKGICDRADSKKGDDWQPYAAEAAAAFAMSFVQAALQPSDTAKQAPEKEPEVGISGVDSRALRLALSTAFSMRELKVVVSDLEVDWDEIPGETKSERIVELIWYMKRRGGMPALVALVKKERSGLLESYRGPEVEYGSKRARTSVMRHGRKTVDSRDLRKLAICGSMTHTDAPVQLILDLEHEIARILVETPFFILHGLQGVGRDIRIQMKETFDFTPDYTEIEGPRDQIIRPADVVLVVGGSTHTKNEVQLSLSFGKPTIPIPCTMGAAKLCYERLKTNPSEWRQWMDDQSFRRLGRLRNARRVARYVKDFLSQFVN